MNWLQAAEKERAVKRKERFGISTSSAGTPPAVSSQELDVSTEGWPPPCQHSDGHHHVNTQQSDGHHHVNTHEGHPQGRDNLALWEGWPLVMLYQKQVHLYTQVVLWNWSILRVASGDSGQIQGGGGVGGTEWHVFLNEPKGTLKRPTYPLQIEMIVMIEICSKSLVLSRGIQ